MVTLDRLLICKRRLHVIALVRYAHCQREALSLCLTWWCWVERAAPHMISQGHSQRANQ